jgi:hypothetical protein
VDLGHHRDADVARRDPAEPGRHPARRPGPDGPGQLGQPAGDRRGLIVDDVALGPQPVGEGELAIEILEVLDLGQPGELVDHHLRAGPPDRLDDGALIERIGDDVLGACGVQGGGLAR